MAWIAGGQIAGVLNNFLLLKILTANLSMATYDYYKSMDVNFTIRSTDNIRSNFNNFRQSIGRE